ncbi:MAG: DUF4838 domain-containing protein [Deltaproteobacteria bacterium]|nr:DUF4838 domain-containing protein [Deltaproteobacteria bacterium]
MPTASSMLSASLGLLTLIVSLAACESTPDLTGPAPSTDAAARDAGSDAGLSDDTGSDAAEHDDAGGEDSGLDAGVPGSDASGSGDTGPDGSLPPPELILVSGGVPAATVVLPQHEHPAERYAAEELARYLRAISGAELPIVVEGGPQLTGPTIEVGKTEAAVSAFPSELTGKPEGIFMEASTERLILTGGSNRAVLYAVYLFLEEKLGCRWLALDVEHVPASPSITLSPFRIVTAPAFDLRTFPARLERNWTWGQKMGFNGLFSAQTEPTDAGFSYLPAAVWGAHGYASIIPPATYSSTHPEWFPLIGGVRKTNGQLCVTAPGLAEEFAKTVAALFTADPHLQHVSISPNDGRIGWCECNACTALDQRLNGGRTTKLGLLPDAPFMGDRAFWFANKVANEVAKTHPHARLLHLAYVNYTEPPDSVTPAANVIPWLAHYAPGEYSRPIADPASAANALFNDYLTRWARKAPRLLFYSYVGKSMWWSLPRPVMSNFAADIRHLSQLGIHRYYAQSPLGDWALDGPL